MSNPANTRLLLALSIAERAKALGTAVGDRCRPSKTLLIEIGVKQSATELDSEVQIDTDYLKQIVGLFHSVMIFHFHPAGFFRRIWQHEPYPIDFPAGSIERSRLQPVGFALPSQVD